MNRVPYMVIVLGLSLAGTSPAAEPPKPFGALPSARQLRWHDLEFYGFLHFTVNTFTDKEWGYGDEPESIFNPTAFDARQIVGAAKTAGMQGLILTAKHHDGFCLWPSKYTEHSVKNSPWRDGKGDVVREISDACRRHGLKFGVYLSPWDRNHKDYARPEYVAYFRNQLRELLTDYGPIYEVWFDGANGGAGYYGGARERRQIGRKTYYGGEETWALVRQLQPEAVMCSDVGPDVRWVGNEQGIAGDPCWATLSIGDWCPGFADRGQLNSGVRGGTHWIPAECDVSIRPGWFYHAGQDSQVRSPENLVQLYYVSVGRGASFLLNLPPDRRGLIHENDVASLRAMREHLDATFAVNLARQARFQASNVRGASPAWAAQKLVDGDKATYWSTDDGITAADVALEFGRPVTFNVLDLREAIALGQRVDRFALDARQEGGWREVAAAEGIGSRRLLRFKPVTTTAVRLRIAQAAACPAIAEMGLYCEPATLAAPTISRDRTGAVSIVALSAAAEVHYTLDGSEPTANSPAYREPIALPKGGTVRARTVAPGGRQQGPVATAPFGLLKSKWRASSAGEAVRGNEPSRAIDERPSTFWQSSGAAPQEYVVDMKESVTVRAFTYQPRQDRLTAGIVDRYAFALSQDGKSWGEPAAAGEFANVAANPVVQTVGLAKPVPARYFKLVAQHTVDDAAPTAAEVGVLVE